MLQSSLNARLLMQYSNSLGKKTSVVSPDPRTQGVAIETGFDTFPSMAALEAGRALDRAVEAKTPVSPLTVGPPVGGAFYDQPPVAATRRPVASPGPVSSPRPRPVAARPAAVAPVAVAAAGPRRSVGFLPWVLAALGLFLVAMILLFFVLPSATVTITVAARSVNIAPTITGSTQPPGPTDRLAVQTALQSAQEQQAQQVTSTGQKIIPGVQATGSVVFSYGTPSPFIPGVDFPKNTEVTTDDGKKFLTTQDSGTVKPGGSSGAVPVVASQGAAAGNVGAGAIKNISNNPDPARFSVTNPSPTQNGTDPQTKTVVSVADMEKAKAQLGPGLTQKVKDDIKGKAGKDVVIADTQAVDLTVTGDHQPGDEVPNFNATVTAKGRATTVNDDRVKQVLRDALLRTVISGYHLTDDPVKLDYKEVQHDESGGVVWDASASGFQATAVNETDLRQNISGKSAKDAAVYVRSHMDALSTNVVLSPPFVPWLPFIAGNIHFRTQVQNTAPG